MNYLLFRSEGSTNLLKKHGDYTEENGEDIDEEYVNDLKGVTDLESDTVEPDVSDHSDVQDMVTGAGLRME